MIVFIQVNYWIEIIKMWFWEYFHKNKTPLVKSPKHVIRCKDKIFMYFFDKKTRYMQVRIVRKNDLLWFWLIFLRKKWRHFPIIERSFGKERKGWIPNKSLGFQKEQSYFALCWWLDFIKNNIHHINRSWFFLKTSFYYLFKG